MPSLRPELDHQTLDKLMNFIEEFRKINPEMTMHQAMSLLWVAKDQGNTITSLCERVGISPSGASRHVEVLGKDGAGLIAIDHAAEDRRKKALILTSAGYRVVNSLMRYMK